MTRSSTSAQITHRATVAAPASSLINEFVGAKTTGATSSGAASSAPTAGGSGAVAAANAAPAGRLTGAPIASFASAAVVVLCTVLGSTVAL